MSLHKSWKILALLALFTVIFTGCAGSKGGGASGDSEGGYSSEEGSSGEGGGSGEGRASASEQKVDDKELKSAQKEATELEKENHDLRREIFNAKNKLGLPVDQASED